MPLLSVAVAIYKVENYLKECIDSILQQTFSDFELILVDDGSPDQCPDICDEYVQKDSRVRVIHQANGGLVSARRTGLLAARGKYVTFVDGDDWLSPEAYEKMVAIMVQENVDILAAGLTKNFKDHTESVVNEYPDGIYRGKELADLKSKLLYNGKFYATAVFPSLCTKMFRTEYLQSLGIDLPHEIRMGEDAGVSYPALSAADSIAIANHIQTYHYRIFNTSMSNSVDIDYFKRADLLFTSMESYFRKFGSTELICQLDYYKLFIINVGIGQILFERGRLSLKEKKQLIYKVCEDFDIASITSRINFDGFAADDISYFQNLASKNINKFLLDLLFSKIRKILLHK